METPLEKSTERLPTLEEVFQPWEIEGKSRRDCLTHRAGLLVPLASLSLLFGVLSCPFPFIGILGGALGLVTWILARRDLDAMDAGNMDIQGRKETEKAWSNGHAGMVVSIIGSLFWLLLATCVYFLFRDGFGLGI